MSKIVFIDTEVSQQSQKILDYGACFGRNNQLHTQSRGKFIEFILDSAENEPLFLCGHNIIHHDLVYLENELDYSKITGVIDTLYLSTLLFPNKPYHALLKDDKLQTDELNNPLNDSIKAMELFYDEVNAFQNLEATQQEIYADLLYCKKEFRGFFDYKKCYPSGNVVEKIRYYYQGKICENCDLERFVDTYPVELAYVLALISAKDKTSIMPNWINMQYPYTSRIMYLMRNTRCHEMCIYCRMSLDIRYRLKSVFGYDNFRKYNGENLQEQATQAAVDDKSLLAIFPTGGGKSITFQLPALIAGEASRALTVVISPLQSLMKDQVDNLEKRGIVDAVAINGLLSPVERAEAIERVESGLVSILYISPESLRSNTIERMLMQRTIARFVIDEAHCFSAWGQDFRVDYLYIGDFIRQLQQKKQLEHPIAVSCFTATAKQKVISDIKDYFKIKLDLDLQLFVSGISRKNLRYQVLYKETDEEKYVTLRWLIEQKKCPTIVYVSRTKRTWELSEKLCDDGISAVPYNGKMDRDKKQENQEAFINDDVQVMVATSAFGMGVDKANVKLVIHYDISSSLEDYMQESGRAGRDQNLEAECYVLFNEADLDKHFVFLNQKRLSISEIQQVWKAIKDLTKIRPTIQRTALEIARQAGWDENILDVEMRVKTAIMTLENAGYIKRGNNVPKIFATSILVRNMMEASIIIQNSNRLIETDKVHASRIVSMLISARSIEKADNGDAESRVDYISDRLGLERVETFRLINILREEQILSDTKDMTAYILKSDSNNKSYNIMKKYSEIEDYLVNNLSDEEQYLNLKEINDDAINKGIKCSTISAIKTILYYWTIKKYIKKSINNTTEKTMFALEIPLQELKHKGIKTIMIASVIVEYLYDKSRFLVSANDHVLVHFSVLELKMQYMNRFGDDVTDTDIENSLLYLSKIGAMRLEGGFLVLYNGMHITRLEMDNKIRYKAEDYKSLNEYYQQKMQQIHIVGEFANMMLRDYDDALQFVNEYFQMDYKLFLAKYFKGNRKSEINRNITPQKYNKLFNQLSESQRRIIDDDKSKYIVVAAGPGSGKTKVLVHKLASLMLLEDVKQEQLLMVTFSRVAAIEFRKRLHELIGNPARFVEIKTFHSYCFDLLGRVGNLTNSDSVVEDATEMIKNGDVEHGKITKTVLVIDEAQDMGEKEYALISALIEQNDELRVIAVGDDDQNIYEFRNSDSRYFESFLERENSTRYEMLDNYRSAIEIVSFANNFVKSINARFKSQPIVSKRNTKGTIELCHCASRNLEEITVKKLQKLGTSGTIGILTNTNDEALRVVGLLKKREILAKLIETNEKFDLFNIAEIRFFVNIIERMSVAPVVDDDVWDRARQRMCEVYKESEVLQVCLNMLDVFAMANPKKYKSDFEIFLHESELQDFYEAEKGIVLVSTIHKAKGREFDKVLMVLNNEMMKTDADKRKLYVGITRARNALTIIYNGKRWEQYATTGTLCTNHANLYGEPDEIMLQLTHKDVNLGFFKKQKNIIRRIVSGTNLVTDGKYLCIKCQEKLYEVVMFSQEFLKKIERQKKQGYILKYAKVRFVVGWMDVDEGREYPIILPDVYFSKD